MLLSSAVKALSVLSGHGECIVGITNDKLFDSTLSIYKDTDSLEFVWLDCEGMDDAVKGFWVLVKERALAEKCHVVLTSIGVNKPGMNRAWQELSEVYKGTKFGNMYLLEYTNLVKPQIVSSMKGIFS